MNLILVSLIVLANAPTGTCEIGEYEVLGIYERESDSGGLEFLDIFFEHGAHIFNAKAGNGREFVGNWTYDDCELAIEFQDEVQIGSAPLKVTFSARFQVIFTEKQGLALRQLGEEESIVLLRNAT